MITVYAIDAMYVISKTSRRAFLHLHPGAEMLASFATVQAARAWAHRQHVIIRDEVTASYTGHRPEGLQRIREAKLGDKNPNAMGLSLEHRKKIAQTMRKRRGEFHHFYNKKHRVRSRLQTSVTLSETWRKHPTRWAVDEFEHSHRITGALPPGWRWGRVKFR